MWDKLIHIIPTVFDLLALTTCIGALGCRLWVLPPDIKSMGALDSDALLNKLWKLLAVCIVSLTLSSNVLLATRSAEMSSLSIPAILPILPKVLFKTHYGQIWLVRTVAIIVLCIGWLIGRQRLDSRAISAFMLCVGAVIAFTRSATSHAADAGDLTLPELMDWFHLISASLWGGGLIVLSTIVLPVVIRHANHRLRLVAKIARRFSTLAGVALAGVFFTGVYNAWFEVGSFHALWHTPYGQTLITKLLFLLALILFGASNRYISIPLLQHCAEHTLTKQAVIYRLLVTPYLSFMQRKLDRIRIARRFMRKVWIEAVLILGVLICAALLQHEIPARHFLHVGNAHALKKSITEEK
ncbi:MAG: CopD family protein [Candidatus Dadabacteria bacterium]|nr:CopD family protein [Candidatus Dadabacteria bacterium]